jgi:hypothetical protein
MTHTQARSTVPAAGARGTSAWVGWIAFAGFMLVMLGAFHVFQGIVALVRDDYFLVTSTGLVVDLDYTTWGWTHIIAGAVVLMAGVGVLAGQMWARVVGTLVAIVSAVVNMVFLPAHPIWSLSMIALAVISVLALTVHGSEIKAGAEET